MQYQKLNVITGWGVWALATIVYVLTIEPTASFWDCGEFIASAFKLEVGHPPHTFCQFYLQHDCGVFNDSQMTEQVMICRAKT